VTDKALQLLEEIRKASNQCGLPDCAPKISELHKLVLALVLEKERLESLLYAEFAPPKHNPNQPPPGVSWGENKRPQLDDGQTRDSS